MKQAINLLTIALLIANLSFAGNEGGAGGDGVKIDGKLYLIDLVEAGAEISPYFQMSLESDPRFENVLKRLASPFSKLNHQETNRLIAIKLIEIAEVNHPLALSILQAIESYQWILVNHALIDIKDEDSVLEFNGGTLTQLAIRRNYSITISRNSWSELNNENKAALIIHEALYAMNSPTLKTKTIEKEKIEYYEQSSPKTRALVGVLFSNDKGFLKPVLENYGFFNNEERTVIYEIVSKETKKIKGWVSPVRARANVIGAFTDAHLLMGEWRDPGNTFPEIFCSDILNKQAIIPKPAIGFNYVGPEFWAQFEFEKAPAFVSELNSSKNLQGIETTYLSWVQGIDVKFYNLNTSTFIKWGQFDYRTCTKKMTDILTSYRELFSQPSVFMKTR